MRVTKLIREYVEKTVRAMPKFKEQSAEEKAYDELAHKLAQFQADIGQKCTSFASAEIQKFREENDIPDDIEIKICDYYMPIKQSSYNCALHMKATTQKENRAKACRNAIEEILVSLELGADRKELDEMLKRLAE